MSDQTTEIQALRQRLAALERGSDQQPHGCEIEYVAACACGWRSGPYRQRGQAVAAYEDHLRPILETLARQNPGAAKAAQTQASARPLFQRGGNPNNGSGNAPF